MRDLGGSRLGTTQFRLGDAVRVRGLEALDEPNTAPPPMPVPAAKSPNAFQTSMRERMHRKLSTAEVAAAVERAFARQEGREPKLPARTDSPVIEELASLDSLEYELHRDMAAARLGIRLSALDRLVKGRRAASEDESAVRWRSLAVTAAMRMRRRFPLRGPKTGTPPSRRA